MDIEPAIASMLVLIAMWRYLHADRRSCVQCSGVGKHRPNCPFNKDEE